MDRERLADENRKLAQMWDQYDSSKLRDYLVADVEDPRLNLQSILTRHFLATLIFPGRFEALKAEEMKFSAAHNWLLQMLKRRLHPDDWHSILHALDHGSDNAEGIEIPWFIVTLFKSLPATADGIAIPHYLREALDWLLRQQPEQLEMPDTITLFETLWREALATVENPVRPQVWEAACGSANDLRFVERYGLGGFLDYTGIDVSQKNIANARGLFPARDFQVGSVLELSFADRAFDACYFHDLLEHLSLDAMDKAVSEICRVTSHTICAGFFSLHEGDEHIVRPLEDYHCNSLSRARLEELFLRNGFHARPVHIESYARTKLGGLGGHNAGAYTIFLDRM